MTSWSMIHSVRMWTHYVSKCFKTSGYVFVFHISPSRRYDTGSWITLFGNKPTPFFILYVIICTLSYLISRGLITLHHLMNLLYRLEIKPSNSYTFTLASTLVISEFGVVLDYPGGMLGLVLKIVKENDNDLTDASFLELLLLTEINWGEGMGK